MKDKLIELYKTVTKSDKTVVKNYENNSLDYNEVYRTVNGFEMSKNSDGIFAEIEIASSTKNEIYTTKTYKNCDYDGYDFEDIFYKNGLDKYYNGHEFRPTKEVELPMDKIYSVGIAFAGNVPNLVLYMTSISRKKETETGILDKTDWTLFGKKITTAFYDITLEYYLKFGSILEKISEKEYKELVELAKSGINRSHELMVDNLLKDFNGKKGKNK